MYLSLNQLLWWHISWALCDNDVVYRRRRIVVNFKGTDLPMPTFARPIFLTLLLLTATCTALADEVLQKAQGLLDGGNAQAAFSLLKPLEESRAGDPAFDYLLGLSAIESGQPLDAVFALERAVEADPTSGPARAELARAYLL